MNPLTQSKNATILPVLIALTLGCFGISPQRERLFHHRTEAIQLQTRAEGEDALFSLTTGVDNTAIGFNALISNTAGD